MRSGVVLLSFLSGIIVLGLPNALARTHLPRRADTFVSLFAFGFHVIFFDLTKTIGRQRITTNKPSLAVVSLFLLLLNLM